MITTADPNLRWFTDLEHPGSQFYCLSTETDATMKWDSRGWSSTGLDEELLRCELFSQIDYSELPAKVWTEPGRSEETRWFMNLDTGQYYFTIGHSIGSCCWTKMGWRPASADWLYAFISGDYRILNFDSLPDHVKASVGWFVEESGGEQN